MEIIVLLVTVALVVTTWGLYRLCGRLRSAAMTAIDAIGLLLAVGLFVYLVIALLYPEKFQ